MNCDTTTITTGNKPSNEQEEEEEEEETNIILTNKPHPEGIVFEEYKGTDGASVDVAKVRRVDLTNNKLSNKIGNLEVLGRLEHLVLRHNFLSNTSFEDLLRVSSTLKELDLYDNQITNFYSIPLSCLNNLT